jgi:hypothetical protein
MQKSDSIGKLAAALSKAQGQIKGAAKDSENPFFKNKYADLTSVWEACREQLSNNELSITQLTDEAEDSIIVETVLMHSSGEWISGRLAIKPVKADPQGVGSAITYARRYALAAIVGVAPEDDDAEAATRPKASTKKEQPTQVVTKKQRLIEKIEGYYKRERELGQPPAKTAKPLSEMSESELLELGTAVAARVNELADEKAASE